jgi:hypothetical protein
MTSPRRASRDRSGSVLAGCIHGRRRAPAERSPVKPAVSDILPIMRAVQF